MAKATRDDQRKSDIAKLLATKNVHTVQFVQHFPQLELFYKICFNLAYCSRSMVFASLMPPLSISCKASSKSNSTIFISSPSSGRPPPVETFCSFLYSAVYK